MDNKTILTSEQLEEFLNELQQVEELPEEIANDIKNNDAWGYGEDTEETTVGSYSPAVRIMERHDARKSAVKRNIDRKNERNARIKQITEAALNDEVIDLNVPLSVYHKRLIITLRTAEYRNRIKGYIKHVNTMASDELKRLTPSPLLKAWKLYKNCVIPAPDFKWTTLDNSYTYIITPDAPFFFKPEDCQSTILESAPDQAQRIDFNIKKFYSYNETVTKLEVSLAQKVAPIKNFFELLKKYPFWYEELVNELKKQ